MSLTNKQRIYLVVDLWPKLCAAKGWNVKEDAKRHKFYLQVFGEEKRSRDFNNADFDKVKQAILAEIRPHDLNAQMAQENMPRTRLIWSITHHWPTMYWGKICWAKFHTRDLEILSDLQLEQLRNTLDARKPRQAAAPESVAF